VLQRSEAFWAGSNVQATGEAMVADLISSQARDTTVRPDLIPVGRFGAVDEVAEVAVMLARNGYVIGQTINVNGGWYMS
jgi:3-oxoacyl-[acyl-carrier protein] reductase